VSGVQLPSEEAEFIASEPSAAARKGISRSAFSPGHFKQFFREIRELGRGGNGVVLLVEHVLDGVSLDQFACKRVPVGNDHDWLEKVLLEVKLLQKVSHTNIVAYKWAWLEDYQPSKFGPKIPCLWMLQDYCNGGDLHTYVLGPGAKHVTTAEKQKEKLRRRSRAGMEPPQGLRGPSKLTFEEIFSFFMNIASGLHHLHSKGYIHRDLKPSNCLLQREGGKVKVLISDFGEVQDAGAKRGSTGATGTISYCAPEVLRRNGGDGSFGNFTTKSDIFSLGMIVYFMCFGRLPYNSADDANEDNEDLDELRAEIMKWSGFDDETRTRPDLPEKLYRFLKRLLSLYPHERPSTDEILTMIKAGAGIEEPTSPIIEDSGDRVSNVDPSRHRPLPPSRKQSLVVGRSGLPPLARQRDPETVKDDGSKTPRNDSRDTPRSRSRPTSPVERSLMRLPRKLDIPIPEGQATIPQSPRLILPPPQETSKMSRGLSLFLGPSVITGIGVTSFVLRVLSLMLPCSPYAANPWLLYPLLGLAILDFVSGTIHYRRSLLLLVLHLVAMLSAWQHGKLCESRHLAWEAF